MTETPDNLSDYATCPGCGLDVPALAHVCFAPNGKIITKADWDEQEKSIKRPKQD